METNLFQHLKTVVLDKLLYGFLFVIFFLVNPGNGSHGVLKTKQVPVVDITFAERRDFYLALGGPLYCLS